mmetsp:Transcript_14009/g.17653  ORF Transcript_14009/g.17653 Transcript_14009/m.17653 type:complete len:301 (+) Transcript_14009:72-974(+)|eukprot:CAMPEP_0172510684 /NCGR_PEP_ID=MMETSP1066-20121228/230627_1 /TAXON_ID=671091 /ORGANISM="Coscinodiscus wailesii, Strain CCMP2513" /LENGTH=300 /DNA_ID=CAMNT_0013289767 /DNA_START=67 /DNA_END=969 /DNA_ORIENTATION=+
MKFAVAALLSVGITNAAAFAPQFTSSSRTRLVVKGYLDDLQKDLQAPDATPDVVAESHEATDMKEEDVDRFGAGSFEDFVEFNEFDGGDGQMGVAGDGSKGLDKMDNTPSFAASKFRSAKNAWGTDSGYADELRAKGVETSRAQQLENWNNQQEIRQRNQQMKYMSEQFDAVTADEDWRTLAKFGVERNTEVDLDATLGEVTVGDNIEGVIELKSNMNYPTVHEFSLLNDYMGFADFRAVLTQEAGASWTIEPKEGSLSSKTPVNFSLKFKPQGPGVSEAYLIIETEDMKKTWKLIGTTA